MKREKIKKFIKEHGVDIAYWTGAVVGIAGTLAGVAAYKMSPNRLKIKPTDSLPTIVMKDVLKMDPKKLTWYSAIQSVPYAPKDLGKLGEDLLSTPGYVDGTTYSHILLFGKMK